MFLGDDNVTGYNDKINTKKHINRARTTHNMVCKT